jgi:23S rRNA pseudouridine1911/1915/1917 synthase
MSRTAEGLSFRIDIEHCGQRLDRVLTELLPDCSRSYLAQLIRNGVLVVNQQMQKPSYRLVLGDLISGRPPTPEPVRYLPEPMDLNIIHEDAHLIVIDKPPGLVVHPAPGHPSGTLVNGLLAHCPELQAREDTHRPGIVHRLDKDTSGVMVAAKDRATHEALAHQFKQRAVRKYYRAIVAGRMPRDKGEIDLPIGRHPVDRKKMSVISRKGRAARTGWQVDTQFDDAALLVLELKTGRTHQARVHCAAIHHGILGDPIYGRPSKGEAALPATVRQALKDARRQMLHAWRLSFVHPVSGQRMTFEAPLPADMRRVLDRLAASSI